MGQFAGLSFGTPATYGVQPANWGISPFGPQGTGMPQLLQWLQILPQQLQQLQILEQQQLVHLQQLLHLVPAQLQQLHQLQQLVQIATQQVQQFQQSPLGSGNSAPLGFGLAPQAFSGSPVSHVM